MFGLFLITGCAALILGAAVGALAVISLGSRREDRERTLTGEGSDRLTRAARRVTWAYSHGLEPRPRWREERWPG